MTNKFDQYKLTKGTHDRVYEVLRTFKDGATVTMLNMKTKINHDVLQAALEEMQVAYIDRYGRIGKRGPSLSPIWMAVDVPEDCPKPDGVM